MHMQKENLAPEQPLCIDTLCNICHSTLMEPVLLPCRHGFCLSCFNGVVKFNSLHCPCCRKRFATWYRKALKENNLISEELSKSIKQQDILHSKKARKTKRKIERSPLETINDNSSVTDRSKKSSLCNPGEIQKEYEEQLKLFYEEIKIEKENELKASAKFLVNIFKEETQNSKLLENINLQKTMLVANPGHTPYSLNTKKTCSSKSSLNANKTSENAVSTSMLSASTSSFVKNLSQISVRINRGTEFIKSTVQRTLLSKFPSSTEGPSKKETKLFTVPPTGTHRSPNRNPGSADSLKKEMCHFKPIRTVPTTPNKRATVISIKIPKAKRSMILEGSEHCEKNKCKTSSTTLEFSPSRNSAFCLVGSSSKKDSTNQTSQQYKINCKRILFQNELLSPKASQNMFSKNVVVKLKRCRLPSPEQDYEFKRKRTEDNNKTTTKYLPTTNKSQKINGRIAEDSRRCGNRQGNRIPLVSALESPDDKIVLEKLIEEQKKCEQLIEQERLDFELAKQLTKANSPAPKRRTTRSKNNNVEFVIQPRRTTRVSVKTRK